MDSETTRTVDEIRAELAANRQSLTGAMGDFVENVKPANLSRRAVAEAKSFVQGEFEAAKAEFHDESGWRTDRLVILGGVVAGAVLLAIVLKKLGNSGPVE